MIVCYKEAICDVSNDMRKEYDTSININSEILEEIDRYSDLLNLSRCQIIMKILRRFIKKSQWWIFFVKATGTYQPNIGSYENVTLHLDYEEVEIFRQIRIITRISTSYIFFIAMKLFGEKILKRAITSKGVRKIFRKYLFSGSYPEYSILQKITYKFCRYRLPFI